MSYWHRKIICPYYLWDTKTKIGCEGKFTLKFDRTADIKKHMDIYCDSWAWEACPHAQQLKQKYERGDKNGDNHQRAKRKN